MPFAYIGDSGNSFEDDVDSLFGSVNFVCLCQGGDGGFLFIDETYTHIITALNQAQYDVAHGFGRGVSSCLVDGTDDGLSVPNSADFRPNTGPWTFDIFIRFNALPSSGNTINIAGVWSGPSNLGWRLQIGNTSGTYSLNFNYSTDGSTQESLIGGNFAFATATNYYIALVVNSSTVYLYVGESDNTTASRVGTGALAGATFASNQAFVCGGGPVIGADVSGQFIGPRVTGAARSTGTTIDIPQGLFPLRAS